MFPIDLMSSEIGQKVLESVQNDSVLDAALRWLEERKKALEQTLVHDEMLVKNNVPTPVQMQLYRHMDHWNQAVDGYTPGYYNPQNVVPHPMQDPGFPFLYDPGMDAYIGFRWDYGDTGPLPPELTPEVIQGLNGLFLANDVNSYYCAHGNKWSRRLTVIHFRVNNYFRAPAAALRSWNFASKTLPMTNNHEKHGYTFYQYSANDMIVDNFDPNFVPDKAVGTYIDYRLHPDYNNLKAAGYDSLLIPACPQTPLEFFLFDPKVQVVQTMWFQVNV